MVEKSVELVSITSYIGTCLGANAIPPERLMIAIARVSSDKPVEERSENVEALIRHCLKNGHWSVFDMIDITFKIRTSLLVAMQCLRHWSFKFQMFSQRYQRVDQLTNNDLRLATGKRSGADGDIVENEELHNLYNEAIEKCWNAYIALIEAGVSKETARKVLPLSTTTEFFMKGSLRSWLHYLSQRLSKHAQKEHRDIAMLVKNEIEYLFPITTRYYFEFYPIN